MRQSASGRSRIIAVNKRIVIAAVLLCTSAAVLWQASGSSEDPRGMQRSSEGVTDAMFDLVDEGMAPNQVASLLGSPSRRMTSLAEGLAWPEPPDTCWYYRSTDRTREYQVCFVAGALVTRGSYPVNGKEGNDVG
jgi:hypothetical protein